MIEKCKKQLDEYFQGKRFDFDLPIKLQCTEFQKRVWKEVVRNSPTIPIMRYYLE